MSSNSSNKNDFISIPKGGGSLKGIGEKFAADLHTGTGNFSIPISLPKGRNGFQPELSLHYSTGNPNGIFGLGWNLSIPNVTRKTSKGIPGYDDCNDVFVLSGFEDLVETGNESGNRIFQPRTEGVFAKIIFHSDDRNSFWEVKNKNGLVSNYGTLLQRGNDPTVIYDSESHLKEFSWMLTKTKNPFGNTIKYTYQDFAKDCGECSVEEKHLVKIEYVDYDNGTKFLVSSEFQYEDRPDCFSNFRSGFEIRTSKRIKAINIFSHPDGGKIPVKKYLFRYSNDSLNKLSLLRSVQLIGFDDKGNEKIELAPLELDYSEFTPESSAKLIPLTGDVPFLSQKSKNFELIDLDGNGLPDIVEFNGQIHSWKNWGNGRFRDAGIMQDAPSVDLQNKNFNLIDANGDGRADILFSGSSPGNFSLEFNGKWDRRSFQPYSLSPTVDLKNPNVRLFDVTGDGITDVVETAANLNFYFNDEEHSEAWKKIKTKERTNADDFPNVSFSDSRVKTGDMNGDGMQDIIFIEKGRVSYWPNKGYGEWGKKIVMQNSPVNLPDHFEMNRLLIGDVDGDGLADIVLIENTQIRLWINQSGKSWSDEIIITGTPPFANNDDVRIIDLLGTGVSGILWSSNKRFHTNGNYFFLDLTGKVKPYLLKEINNNIGSVTRVEYASSADEFIRDSEAGLNWQSHLPFPVLVVKKVEVIDQVSKSKLSSTYKYHSGHWDGEEREFRGFGMVEQFDTEVFDDYHDLSLFRSELDFISVDEKYFSPPTLTKTWFHLGPIRKNDGEWQTADFSDEYSSRDEELLNSTPYTKTALSSLRHERHRRDAFRALRGKILRQEVFVKDKSPLENIPFSVQENSYGLRVEYVTENPKEYPVIFPFQAEQRETRWERGDDPLTVFKFIDDYDSFGQHRKSTKVTMPRRLASRKPTIGKNYSADLNESRILATFQDTRYASPVTGKYIHDRVCEGKSFFLKDDAINYNETNSSDLQQILRDQYAQALSVHRIFSDAVQANKKEILSHTLNYYDGNALNGLPLSLVDDFGALVKTETLAFKDEHLESVYTISGSDKRRPTYLNGNAPVIANTPAGFGNNTGYVLKTAAPYESGYYIVSVQNRYDFQIAGDTKRGLLKETKDPLGNSTVIEYDEYDFLPYQVTDTMLNRTIADYDYRVFSPGCITDINSNTTWFEYTALGLPQKIYKQNQTGDLGGNTDDPDLFFEYSFRFIHDPISPIPIFVDTIARVEHTIGGSSNETIRSREYSDGFGRLIQKIAQADDVKFGVTGDINGLNADQSARNASAIGTENRARTDKNKNTVVSGWQVFNNKGWIVEKYEPFYSTGYDYKPELRVGVHVEIYFDSIGRQQQIFNPDGSQQLLVYGVLPDLTDPHQFNPSPWEQHIYDANDLAVEGGLDSANTAEHHYTPSSVLTDALGRILVELKRNGDDETNDWFITHTAYDIKGNPLVIRDSKNRAAFQYHYDLLDRVLQINSIDAGIRTKVYDAVGNIIEYRDSKGSVVLKEFDTLNRPENTWVRNHSGVAALRQAEHIIYGENAPTALAVSGNLRGWIYKHYDEVGLTTFTAYDLKGNLLDKNRRVIKHNLIGTEINWQGKTNNTVSDNANPNLDNTAYQTSYEYDVLNRIIKLTYPADVNGNRAELETEYNPSGKLRGVSLVHRSIRETYVQHIAYNAKDQRMLIAYGNNIMTRYAYDSNNFRLMRLRTEAFKKSQPAFAFVPDGKILQDFGYEFDPVGNITSIKHREPESGILNSLEGADALTRLFTYDAIYRLLTATGREAEQPGTMPDFDGLPKPTDHTLALDYKEIYEYDEAGNFLFLRHKHNNATVNRVRTFTNENNSNRLQTVSFSGNDFNYTYDENGNLIQEGLSRFMDWDHSDRMISFEVSAGGGPPSKPGKYHYDTAGMRVIKKNKNLLTIYIDGIFEHTVHISNGEENNHLHIMDNQSRIAMKRVGDAMSDTTPEVQYHLADHLGSSNRIVGGDDSSESRKISLEEYSPYGETTFGSHAKKLYRYSGKERDKESGMYYYGARYYLPWLGRWGSCDPIGINGGINLFISFNCNPQNHKDDHGYTAEPTSVEIELQQSIMSTEDVCGIKEKVEATDDQSIVENVIIEPPQASASSGGYWRKVLRPFLAKGLKALMDLSDDPQQAGYQSARSPHEEVRMEEHVDKKGDKKQSEGGVGPDPEPDTKKKKEATQKKTEGPFDYRGSGPGSGNPPFKANEVPKSLPTGSVFRKAGEIGASVLRKSAGPAKVVMAGLAVQGAVSQWDEHGAVVGTIYNVADYTPGVSVAKGIGEGVVDLITLGWDIYDYYEYGIQIK